MANSRLVHPICFHAELSSVSKHDIAAYVGLCSREPVSYDTVT